MATADFSDYLSLENDDLIVLALKLGFQEAQQMCAKLGMKPHIVRDGSWWIEPWVHEKLIEAHLFGSMEEDECNYDHTFIDDLSTQGGEKENCCVQENDSNTCKDAFVEAEGMQSWVEDDLHEVVQLESELRHTLDVLVDEHEGAQIPSPSNVKSIIAYLEVGESRIFKSTLVSQLNGNPTLSKDQLTRIKASILYMKPKLLSVGNHDTMLKLGCDCGVYFLNTPEARSVKK